MPRPYRLSCLIVVSMFLTTVVNGQTKSPTVTSVPTVTAAVTANGVRFVAFGEVQQMRLEVFDAAGVEVFDSGFRAGNVRDWSLKRKRSQAIADGTYQLVVTIRDLDGRLSLKQCAVSVQDEQAALALGAAELATGPEVEQVAVAPAIEETAVTAVTHDGREGQLTRTRGAFSFRLGDFFRGNEQEQMRLTEDGKLGIGTTEPQAKLDVAGDIRAAGNIQATQGISFPDGTVQTTGLSGRRDADGNLIPNAAGTGTQNQIAKWAETGGAGTLTNSIITETPAGNIGISNAAPTTKLSVLGAAGAELRFDKGAQSITPVLNVISQPANTTLGAAAGLAAGGGGSSFNFSDNLPFFIVKDTKSNVVNNNLGFGTPLLTVHPSGNVGVGPTNPTAKLDVSGNINTSTQYNIGGNRVLAINAAQNNTIVGITNASVSAGGGNTFVGVAAGANNTIGVSNVFVGIGAGSGNTNGAENTYVGGGAGLFGNGSGNSFFGRLAGSSMQLNSNANSFFGANAGAAISSGGLNSFFGWGAGLMNTTGANNTFLGVQAGAQNLGGGNNTFVGKDAGDGNQSGQNNTLIGTFADVATGAISNGTAIGYRAAVSQANSLVLGSIDGVNGASADTKVGIGTTAPNHRLTVGAQETPITTDAQLGIYGSNTAYSLMRETSLNVELIAGVDVGFTAGKGLFGTMTNHPITFVTNNAHRMTISNTGEIGIGTISPATRLHIGTGSVYISNQGSGVILKALDGDNCYLMRVVNSGALSMALIPCP